MALKGRITSIVSDVVRYSVNTKSARNFKVDLASWVNVSRRGNYNNVHDHPGAMRSGVYYVSVGKPDNDDPFNGRLQLFDPRNGVGMEGMRAERQLINPQPGLLVMFPSWLRHMVHPFFGDEERISIAFNVIVKGLVSES